MMGSLMRIAFLMAQPFMLYPELAYLMAMAFMVLFVVSTLQTEKYTSPVPLGILFTSVCWVGFGLLMRRYQGAEIRVDVLFSWPPLLVVSLTTGCLGIWQIVAKKPTDQTKDESMAA